MNTETESGGCDHDWRIYEENFDLDTPFTAERCTKCGEVRRPDPIVAIISMVAMFVIVLLCGLLAHIF